MNKIIKFLGSRAFLFLVICLFVVQALWIALSFRYPMPFDEAFHFGAIQIHSHHLSPFLSNQPVSFDNLGDLPANSHGLYHYIMSFPYRFAELFTQNTSMLILIMRTLNIAMVAVGLWLYAKLLEQSRVKSTYVNLGLLFFILLPIVPYISATVSYDNMLFPLTALCLLFAVKIVQAKQVSWRDYAKVLLVGLIAILAKFTFMPVLAIIIVFLLIDAFSKYKTNFFKKFYVSFAKDSFRAKSILLSLVIIFSGIFVYENARNIILYGAAAPPCDKVMSVERCNKSWGVARKQKVAMTKNKLEFDVPSFTLGWVKRMTALGNTGSSRKNMKIEYKTGPHILRTTLFFACILGASGILYAWRSLKKDRSWYLLLVVAVGLITSIFIVNLYGYTKTHQFFANQPRYNLSVIPILITFTLVSYSYILRKHRNLKVTILIIGLLLFTQGGGVITHIVKSNDTWYWDNARVIRANHYAKKILDPIVVEK